MNTFARLFPAIVVAICGFWVIGKAAPPHDADGAFKVREFGVLPVVYQGRVKPYDTLARNALTIISDRQTWRDAEDHKRPAIEWLLDVMSNAPRAADERVFRIHNLELQSQLGLERRKGYRYAYHEFSSKLDAVEKQSSEAQAKPRGQRDVYDNQVLEFSHKVMLYHLLSEAHRIPHISSEPEQFRADLNESIRRVQNLERFSPPLAIPPHAAGEDWKLFLRAVLEGAITQDPNPAVQPLAEMLTSWREGDVASFNKSLADYHGFLAEHPLREKPALRFEAFFNHFAPFYDCAALYVIALTLAFFSWLGWSRPLGKATFALLAFTFAVHTFALGSRVYISGYPPITNLYGTAVFIGWGCVLLGLILESIYSLGIGNMLAAGVGFVTLIIAHFLAGDGDTLEMMQAVLDTKFWLATHVIIINFGYSATFLAGGISLLYLLRGVFTRSLDKDGERVFGRMIYGVTCFALLLSFVGTVLGGLWADDSWGRFWGWDPKENGALLIVIWNALILHARWGGMVKTRGIAVLSVFGNIVTSWSWFGVNQLGVGLHSYGFTDSITFWLLIFVGTQLGVIAIGLLPRSIWRSAANFQKTAKAKTAASTNIPHGGVQPSFRAR